MVYIVFIGNKGPRLFTQNFSFDFHSFNMGTKLIIFYLKCLQAVHALSDMKQLAACLVDM